MYQIHLNAYHWCLTKRHFQATGYFEGTWVWTADHDLDDSGQRQIDVYTGRGIVSESANGPVWLIGTASEHAAIVQVRS